jgi:ion channel
VATPPAEPTPRRAQPAGGLARRGDRYGLLLLLLVFSYLMSAFTTSRYTGAAEILLFVGALLLALRTSEAGPRAVRVIVAVVVIGSMTSLVLVLSHVNEIGIGVADLWTALILLVTVVVIVRRVLIMPTVSLQSIFGAVSAYMIIGLMFAAIYAAMGKLVPGPFFSGGSPANVRTFQYFSFTTLTTLGYGDFTAAGNGGRAVAVLEALGGQIFLATLVARLVASYRTPRREHAEASTDRGQRAGLRRRGAAGGAAGGVSHRGAAKWRSSRRRLAAPGSSPATLETAEQPPPLSRSRQPGDTRSSRATLETDVEIRAERQRVPAKRARACSAYRPGSTARTSGARH